MSAAPPRVGLTQALEELAEFPQIGVNYFRRFRYLFPTVERAGGTDAGICHVRAAVKIPPLIVFFSLLVLSLLSLLASYWLSLNERTGATQFLVASIFFAVLCAVIGTNGKVSMLAITKFVRAIRHG